jgi:RsiW-degrading membrane proteinase PrsW (M82 family)
MVAVLVALPLQAIVKAIYPDNFHDYVLWAFIEEILKFAAVYVVVFHHKKMDEPIDALIYMITAALGFAALENTFFMLQIIHSSDIASVIITGNLRFIGAILLHIVSSATVGFMLAITFYRGKLVKWGAAILGIAIAGALHATFNLAIINSTGFNTLRAFGWVWAGIVLLVILFEEVKAIKPPRIATVGK